MLFHSVVVINMMTNQNKLKQFCDTLVLKRIQIVFFVNK